MSEGTIVAILSCVGTILGSGLGVITSSRLTSYRLEQLEKKVAEHNNLVERTYKLEGEMLECQHDIRDLKNSH